MSRPPRTRSSPTSSWDAVAPWYDSWVGRRGSPHHRQVAIPTVLRLGEVGAGTRVVDIGCGQGVLARHVYSRGASYLGVDASGAMIELARARHGDRVEVLHADARGLATDERVPSGAFDVAVFMLSIQDMDPLDDVVASAAALLTAGGAVVVFMTHPCFRVPRGSGWGYDEARKLRYRRVEQYLTDRAVPMKEHASVSKARSGTTVTFHRPLSSYVASFARHGLVVDALEELADPVHAGHPDHAPDIPAFLALRALLAG